MFQITKSSNRIKKLEEKRFAEMKIREREHLQEWLANQPDALGEDLLIIQKEFAGFADTRERLDLLAMDKDGQLVIIENKLDDTGRDVTWQALKYTAYVSSLSKKQIIDIYQQYLDRYCGGGQAAEALCEFLEVEELDEVVLNPGNGQRLILIAANFRKEVTSTVLWLREHQIDARCFKATLYAFNEDLFIDIQPVIPTPEAAEFMIGMAEKETAAKVAQGEMKARQRISLEYWTKTLEALRAANVSLYQNVSPNKDHWLTAGSGLAACPYEMILLKKEIRVGFSFNRGNQEENKWLFDRLYEHKDEIEKALGHKLDWLRLNHRKSSRLQLSHDCDGFNKDDWDEYADWHVGHIQKLECVLAPYVAKLIQEFSAWEGPAAEE